MPDKEAGIGGSYFPTTMTSVTSVPYQLVALGKDAQREANPLRNLAAQPDCADAHAACLEKFEFGTVGQEAVDLTIDGKVADFEFAFFHDELPTEHGGFFDGVGTHNRSEGFDALDGCQGAHG